MVLIPLLLRNVGDCLYIYCEKTIRCIYWFYLLRAYLHVTRLTNQSVADTSPQKALGGRGRVSKFCLKEWLVSLACKPDPNHSNLINIHFIYPCQVHVHMNPYWVNSMVNRSDLELETWKTKSEWVLRGLWDFCPVPGKHDIWKN